MYRRMVENEVNGIYTCKWTGIYCPRSLMCVVESVYQSLSWIWVLLLISLPSVYLYIVSLHSSTSRLLLPYGWSEGLTCYRVFSVFLLSLQILVVSPHLATDGGLSMLLPFLYQQTCCFHCQTCGRGQRFSLLSLFSLSLTQALGLGNGAFSVFLSFSQLALCLQLLLGGSFLPLPQLQLTSTLNSILAQDIGSKVVSDTCPRGKKILLLSFLYQQQIFACVLGKGFLFLEAEGFCFHSSLRSNLCQSLTSERFCFLYLKLKFLAL